MGVARHGGEQRLPNAPTSARREQFPWNETARLSFETDTSVNYSNANIGIFDCFLHFGVEPSGML